MLEILNDLHILDPNQRLNLNLKPNENMKRLISVINSYELRLFERINNTHEGKRKASVTHLLKKELMFTEMKH